MGCNNNDDSNGESSDEEYSDNNDDGGSDVSNKSLLETFQASISSNNSREFGGTGDIGGQREGRGSSGRGSGKSQRTTLRSSNVVQHRNTQSAAAALQQAEHKLG